MFSWVRFPIADKSLSNRRQIASLTPMPNTRCAAVVSDVCYCAIAITSHLYVNTSTA